MALCAIENLFDAFASNALAPYESLELGILLSNLVDELKHLSNRKSKCFTTRALPCREILVLKKEHDLKVWNLRGLIASKLVVHADN